MSIPTVAYGNLLEEGSYDPFTAQTGIQIKSVPGVSFAKLKAQVQNRNFDWNVINLGDVEYGQAVLEGLIEKVDKSAAKTDQLPPHMVRDYGIVSYSLGQIWSTVKTGFQTAVRKAGQISGT